MYRSNRNRVKELMAGMQVGQNLPEIALAMPGHDFDDEVIYYPPLTALDNAARELPSILDMLKQLNRDTEDFLRGI